MSRRGFELIADKFYEKTGLWHIREQFRNRINQLKGLYGFWVMLQKQSGLGLHADGTVAAPGWWWKENVPQVFAMPLLLSCWFNRNS